MHASLPQHSTKLSPPPYTVHLEMVCEQCSMLTLHMVDPVNHLGNTENLGTNWTAFAGLIYISFLSYSTFLPKYVFLPLMRTEILLCLPSKHQQYFFRCLHPCSWNWSTTVSHDLQVMSMCSGELGRSLKNKKKSWGDLRRIRKCTTAWVVVEVLALVV